MQDLVSVLKLNQHPAPVLRTVEKSEWGLRIPRNLRGRGTGRALGPGGRVADARPFCFSGFGVLSAALVT